MPRDCASCSSNDSGGLLPVLAGAPQSQSLALDTSTGRDADTAMASRGGLSKVALMPPFGTLRRAPVNMDWTPSPFHPDGGTGFAVDVTTTLTPACALGSTAQASGVNDSDSITGTRCSCRNCVASRSIAEQRATLTRCGVPSLAATSGCQRSVQVLRGDRKLQIEVAVWAHDASRVVATPGGEVI